MDQPVLFQLVVIMSVFGTIWSPHPCHLPCPLAQRELQEEEGEARDQQHGEVGDEESDAWQQRDVIIIIRRSASMTGGDEVNISV